MIKLPRILLAVPFLLLAITILLFIKTALDPTYVVDKGYIKEPVPIAEPPQEFSSYPSEKSISWGDFINLGRTPLSTAHTLRNNRWGKDNLQKLNICDQQSSNTKIASTNTSLSAECDVALGASLVIQWKQRRVPALCEAKSASSIDCYDSPGNPSSRFCVFENALMNFKKMRLKTRSDGKSKARGWERGFLSAECGEGGKDNIGLPLYTPDIEGSADARCDHFFNETVLMISHEDSRNLPKMTNDLMNVLVMMRLVSKNWNSLDWSRRITLLNIDSVRPRSHYAEDQPSEYFIFYEHLFRRIIKAVDLGSKSRVCFKRLIMQPRPMLRLVAFQDTPDLVSRCSGAGSSALFQSMNLQIRQALGLERYSEGQKSGIDVRTVLVFQHASITASVLEAIHQIAKNRRDIKIVSISRKSMPFKEILSSVHESSIIIGAAGADLSTLIAMPMGSARCCGVLQFVSSEQPIDSSWGNLARLMGFQHAVSSEAEVAADLLQMVGSVEAKSSCVLPAVLK